MKSSVKKQVVVLGGSGFLGKHVKSELAKRSDVQIFSLSRREGCDIIDFTAFVKKLKEINPYAIINCAAHVGSLHYVTGYAADVIHDNMQIVLNIYRAVKDACSSAKIVNPISNCSYPGNANTHYEPDWQMGAVHDSVLAYGSTRRMIYAVSESYRKQYRIKTINWLVANAYGPGDYTDPNRVHALNGIIIRLIRAKRSGEKEFEIWGTGKPTREWAYVEDVANILVKSAFEVDEQTSPLNFAQNKAYSIAEIATIVAQKLDYPVQFTFNTSYPDGAPFKILDDRLFRNKYPDFKFTPLETGIKNTIRYYESALV